jgi:hypothetical protein
MGKTEPRTEALARCHWPPLSSSVRTACDLGREFFANHAVTELLGWSDFHLEYEGRLTHPIVYEAGSDTSDGSAEAKENGIVGETPKLAAFLGSMPRRSYSASIKDGFDRHHCKGHQENDCSPAAPRSPTVILTHTSSFQYSLTSYLRTSSTQVVSSPCRGMSRS